MIVIRFERGTLLLDTGAEDDEALTAAKLPRVSFDPRVRQWRAPAIVYRDLLTGLREHNLDFDDQARAYEEVPYVSSLEREPFPYQAEAVEAWLQAGRRGVVVLPTGAGKTFVAQLIIEQTQRSALVVTPTIDLMQQWYGVLSTSFDLDVGLLGGGHHEPKPLTITTYDSAYLHMERLGNRYGLLVFDECHHLPGPSLQFAAECSLAPFRLGLTATPEREDGQDVRLPDLIGPILYRQDIKELSGSYLSDYETVQLKVRLTPEERERYAQARAVYRDFLASNRIRLGGPDGWNLFLTLSSRSEAGRRAFLAYQEQKAIAQASPSKLRLLSKLLRKHSEDRALIFTSDNETVYRISRQFLIPAITHQSKVKERHEILERFNSGVYPFLVTSKVLNEGVDVPAANVGIILSGSGSVREHVQRLGRILRRAKGKHATLYEVVTEDTAEEFVSSRRREHSAYR